MPGWRRSQSMKLKASIRGDVLPYPFDVGVLEAGVGRGDAELPGPGVDRLGVPAAAELFLDQEAEFTVERVEHG
jgi:hypothetical protein